MRMGYGFGPAGFGKFSNHLLVGNFPVMAD